MNGIIRFLGIIMAALAAGAIPLAYAAEGWVDTKIRLASVAANGTLRVSMNPTPQNTDFLCSKNPQAVRLRPCPMTEGPFYELQQDHSLH